jgi:hypothetical protein
LKLNVILKIHFQITNFILIETMRRLKNYDREELCKYILLKNIHWKSHYFKKHSSEINSDDECIYSLIISNKINAIKCDMNNNNRFEHI